MEKGMPIRKRLVLLSLVGLIAGFFYVPFVGSRGTNLSTLAPWLDWTLGAFAATLVCGWAGLKIADRWDLPMPFLRPWERKQPTDKTDRQSFVRICFAVGGIFGLLATLAVHLFSLPLYPGNFGVRIATVPFAAIVSEVVGHLFLMSLLMVLFKRSTPAILVSALVFPFIFHPSVIMLAPAVISLAAIEYLLAVATGWVYSRYGIEGAILTHAVASIIILGIN
jgi:hypothetical protein